MKFRDDHPDYPGMVGTVVDDITLPGMEPTVGVLLDAVPATAGEIEPWDDEADARAAALATGYRDEMAADPSLTEQDQQAIHDLLGRSSPPLAYSAGSGDLRDGSQDLGRSDWMQTFTGRAFYALDPRIEDICIEDIAHALSMLCRYGGHSRLFYSVAEHSVLMSLEVAPEHALWALLHDSTEAYMGDLIRPLKRAMPVYAAAEDNLMGLICARFGLPIECPAEVKQADTRILLDERRALLGPSPQKWGASIETAEPLGVQVQAWEPDQAEFYYLARFRELRGAA